LQSYQKATTTALFIATPYFIKQQQMMKYYC